MKKTLFLVFGVIFVGLGVFITNNGFTELQRAKQSETWPSVSGVITKSELVVTKKKRTGKKRRRNKTSYKPKIEYSYQVENKQYSNNQLSFSGYRSDKSGVEATVNFYPVTKVIDVFYNPTNPQESVLEKGASKLNYVLIGAGVVFGLFGLFFCKMFFT